jgi:hypothetical protein
MNVRAVLNIGSVDTDTHEDRRAELTRIFRQARERARISAVRYVAALESGDAARIAEAADGAALDAGYVSGFARHVANHP